MKPSTPAGPGEEDDDFSNNGLIFMGKSVVNKWLKKRGKGDWIDFDDEELKKLRYYFDCLDEK